MSPRLKVAGCLGFVVGCRAVAFYVWPTSDLKFASQYPRGYGSLMAAIDDQNVSSVKRLLDDGVDPNKYPNTDADMQEEEDIVPLDYAAEIGNVQIVSLLLRHHADPNLGDGWHFNPLAAATVHESTDVMQVLLKHGATINDQPHGCSALWRAAVDGKVKSVRFLLDRGALPNTHMLTDHDESLLSAMKNLNGSTEIIQILRQRGAKE